MLQILIILFCLALNGLIAATEFAFIAISKPRLRKLAHEGHEPAARVLKLRENPEKILSILQLGITFIGVIAAAVGGSQIGGWISNWLKGIGYSQGFSETMSILLFVLPYTYVNVVFSELLPKSLALRNPKWIIFHVDRWLILLSKILAPIIFLLEKSTKLGINFLFSWVKKEEGDHSTIVEVGRLIHPYALNLAKFEKTAVTAAMIPWEEADKITSNASLDEVKQTVLRTGHTRVPIVDQEGRPMGILFSKKFLGFYETKQSDWQSLITPILHLQVDDSLINGLKAMQSNRSHMSLVAQGEAPIGIVTIEDILEEVVGEIYDEDDPKSM